MYYLANRFARYICDDDPEGFESTENGLRVLINFIGIIIISIIIGLCTGTFVGTLLSLAALTATRSFSGGHHLRSSDLCVVVSVLIIVAPAILTSKFNISYISLIDVIVLSIIIVASPFGTMFKKVSKTNLSNKLLSTIAIISNLIFLHRPEISLVLAIQAIDLLLPSNNVE